MTREKLHQSEVRPDLCVIGLDPAGFEIAFGAAALGVPVVLVTQVAGWSVPAGLPDPLLRLVALGARVVRGAGVFTGPRTFEVAGEVIRARRFVVATGADPVAPPIEGVAGLPRHDAAQAAGSQLVIFGAGAEGVALAGRARAGGARVTLLAEGGFLHGFDPDGAGVLRMLLERQGVVIRDAALAGATLLEGEDGARRLVFADGTGPVAFSHAAFDLGLAPRLAGIDAERAGIRRAAGKPLLSDALRSTNRRIYICGAATGIAESAARSSAEAAAILKEILFRRDGRLEASHAVRLVAANPALAEVGLREKDIPAGKRAGYRFLRVPLDAGEFPGHLKVIVTRKGVIRGASVLAPQAASLITPFALALETGVPLPAFAGLALPSGAARAVQQVAAQFLREAVMAPSSLRLVRLLRWFG